MNPSQPVPVLTIADLLAALGERGIQLRAEAGKLAIQAPRGALTPQLRGALQSHKAALVQALERRAAASESALPVLAPDAAARHLPFPLTDVQYAYWMGRNVFLELGGVSTHFYFELDSRFELPRLEVALRKVIAHHDMLRAVIQPDGQQRVLAEALPYAIRAVDVRGLPTPQRDAEFGAIRSAMSHQVLPADRWPLFEVRATLLDDATVRLHISLDLLVIDGASIFMLLRDWHRFCEHPRWSPPPLPIAYRDYVLAEKSLRGSPAWHRARRYWLDRLDDLPPRPELPVLPRKDDLPPRFTRRRARLACHDWASLKHRAQEEGATPSVLLMAAFAEVLRGWAKEPDFTLNLTLFNRLPLHPEVGGLLGDFTSLTLLAVHGRVREPFAARLGRLQRQLSQDLEHARFGGVEVLRELSRRGGGAAAAAMPVVFTSALVYEDEDDAPAEPVGEFVHGVSQTPQVWLDHQVFEERGELVFNWDAVEDLFPAGMLDDMFSAWRALLERLARDPGAWAWDAGLAGLPNWQGSERECANATRADIPARTLNALVEDQAQRTPDAVAVIAEDGVLTYRKLGAYAFRLARRLLALGARPDALVAVMMEKGWEQVAAVLGVQHSGAAYLPIDPSLPEERRALLLQQGGVRIVVTQ